jgi:hypothetical protein
VGVFPIGVDFKQLQIRKWVSFSFRFCEDSNLIDECRRELELAEWVQVLKQPYAGMKAFVGRDKFDQVQARFLSYSPIPMDVHPPSSHRASTTKSYLLKPYSRNT